MPIGLEMYTPYILTYKRTVSQIIAKNGTIRKLVAIQNGEVREHLRGVFKIMLQQFQEKDNSLLIL